MLALVRSQAPSSAAIRLGGPALLVTFSFVVLGCHREESDPPAPAPTGPVQYLAFSPDGRTVVAGSYWVGTHEPEQFGRYVLRVIGVVSSWDVSTGRAILSSRGKERPYHEWRGTSLEIPQRVRVMVSPDGRRLACGVGGGVQGISRNIYLTNTVSGEELPICTPGAGRVGCFRFSPDGRVLAVQHGESVTFCGESPPKPISLQGPPSAIGDIAFSPDGRRLACASGEEGTLTVWDLTAGEKEIEFAGHSGVVHRVLFSPGGGLLASASDRSVKIWQAGTGGEVRALPGCSELAFSQDGRLLAGLTAEAPGVPQKVVVWDVPNGREVRVCWERGESAPKVTALTFDPPASRLAAGDEDGSVTVWDVP